MFLRLDNWGHTWTTFAFCPYLQIQAASRLNARLGVALDSQVQVPLRLYGKYAQGTRSGKLDPRYHNTHGYK